MVDDKVSDSAANRRHHVRCSVDDRGVVRIRIARVDDVPAIATFQTECWREAYRGLVAQSYLDRVGVSERERSWAHRLVHATREVANAECDGQIVGVVSWRADPLGARPGGDAAGEGADLPPLELASLYVAAGHRGTGLAGDLLRRALGSAPAFLWVFADNPRANAFYAKHGFLPDGETVIDPGTRLVEQRLLRR